MRYLPTLEIGQTINQVALPDIHAIELAELCLTHSGNEKIKRCGQSLLSSPMLLFWIWESWKLERQSESIKIEELPEKLATTLGQCATRLIKDHHKPLTSISRIEANSFFDFQVFFHYREERSQTKIDEPFQAKILDRLSLLQHLFGSSDFGSTEVSLRNEWQHKVANEKLVAEFENTEFSQVTDRESIVGKWFFELPQFRDGLGPLEAKINRLDKLETEFEEVVQRAKISAMQQLAYGASHEINNPLANISTRAQALLRDEQDPKRRQRLKTIDAQAFRAHDMISNLMTFAKPRRPNFTRFQVRPAVEAAVEKLARIAEEQQVEIKLECEYSVYIEADREQFGEVIYALVENAIESIRQNGTIQIQCQNPDAGQPILVEVTDTGPGISAEIREHIFDPFFSGREAGRGLGFGLSKVWRLMELHNGSIRMNEKHGLTVVELKFPASQEVTQAMDVEKTA